MWGSAKTKCGWLFAMLCLAALAGGVLRIYWGVSDRGIPSGKWKLGDCTVGRGDDALFGDGGFVGADGLRDGIVYIAGQPRLEIVQRDIRLDTLLIADSSITVRSLQTGQVCTYYRKGSY